MLLADPVGRAQAWVYGRSLAGIVGSNPAGNTDGCPSLVSVVYCWVKVSATGLSLVQRSPVELDVSQRDREASTVGGGGL